MRTVSRCNPNTRETSRMLIPSTITARRTSRYTSTWYIHPTTHKHDFEPMDGTGRYIFQPPQCQAVNPSRWSTLPPPFTGRQRVANLDQQLSARIHEIQDLEQRATTAERERANVTSLYFKLEHELQQASQRTTELEQQLSASMEVQHLGQSAAAAEKQSDNLNMQLSESGPGLVRKLLEFVGAGPEMPRSKGPRLGIVRRIPSKKVTSKSYDERVTIFAGSGELLGAARLVGQANYTDRTGLWSWRAQLFDTSFEPDILRQAGELRIEFKDGTVGRAICHDLSYQNGNPSIHLIGNGTPPGVT